MKRTTATGLLTAGALVLIGCAGGGGATDVAPDTLAEATSLAAQRGVPLVLDFYTDW